MVNYYEELNLDKNASASELMKELVKMEVTWQKNEVFRPELAAEKLVLINQAKKVFASDAAKNKYDSDLFATPEDPDAARRAQFKKWYEDAQAYFESSQYDLAKTALENAMNYIYDEDPAFYSLAASIYLSNGDTSMAMTNINKAIVMQPDEAGYYLSKGVILEKLYSEAWRYNGEKANEYLMQERETLRRAAKLASAANNSEIYGCTIGLLAHSLYYYEPRKVVQAEELAKEAVKSGDIWGNGQKILDDAEKKRDKARKLAEQQRREHEERIKATQQWEEKRKREEREYQEAQSKKNRNKALKSGIMILSLAGMLLTLAIGLADMGVIPGLPLLGYQELAAMAAICLFAFNFACVKYIDSNPEIIKLVDGAFGVFNCILLTTIQYNQLGHSRASGGEAWKLVAVLIVVFVISSVLGIVIGSRVD